VNIFHRTKSTGTRSHVPPAELQLAPLPIDAPLGAGTATSLVVYVIDPTLNRSHDCEHAHALLKVIEQDPPDPNAPPTTQLGEFIRTEISHCEPLKAFKATLTTSFVDEWTEFGEKAALAERQYGVQPRAGSINSVTSAALIGATTDIDDPVEALLAQHLLRRAYALCRASDDGSISSVIHPQDIVIDERLFLLSVAPRGVDAIGRWFEHSPLDDEERAELEELLLGTTDHIEFAAIVHTANRMMWAMGERHHG